MKYLPVKGTAIINCPLSIRLLKMSRLLIKQLVSGTRYLGLMVVTAWVFD